MTKKVVKVKSITSEDLDIRIEETETLIFKVIRTLVKQVNSLEKEVNGLVGARVGLVEECADIHDRVYDLEKNIELIKERRNLK